MTKKRNKITKKDAFQLQIQFAKMVHCFNFELVDSVMRKTNWTWYGDADVPSISKMVEMCYSLFEKALESVIKHGVKSAVSSGGFQVEINARGETALRFLITDIYSYELSGSEDEDDDE